MVNAQNIKLEDRDPLVLREKLERVVVLVSKIKVGRENILNLTAKLAVATVELKADQGELKLLEGELFVKVRKPRALKPILKNPPSPPKERKTRKKNFVREPSKGAGDAGGDVIPGKIIDISAKSGETAPGDPRQTALPIDEK